MTWIKVPADRATFASDRTHCDFAASADHSTTTALARLQPFLDDFGISAMRGKLVVAPDAISRRSQRFGNALRLPLVGPRVGYEHVRHVRPLFRLGYQDSTRESWCAASSLPGFTKRSFGDSGLLGDLARSIRSLAADDKAGRRWSKEHRYSGLHQLRLAERSAAARSGVRRSCQAADAACHQVRDRMRLRPQAQTEARQPVGEPVEIRWAPQWTHPPAQHRFGHALR